MTVVINPNSRGHLIGSSRLNSEFLRGAQLEVTVTGSTVVLAGIGGFHARKKRKGEIPVALVSVPTFPVKPKAALINGESMSGGKNVFANEDIAYT